MDSLLDVLIIGAGASGIATYASLKAASSHSLKLHIIEARDRIGMPSFSLYIYSDEFIVINLMAGGRIWTVQNDLPFPLELGAEFIHGDNAVTHAFRTHLSRIKKSSGFLVQMSGLSAIDVARFDRNHMFWAASPGACALNLSKY